MKRKYEKPLVRRIGEIDRAEGLCGSGSVANTGRPDASDSQGCYPGSVASGSGCGFGQTPGQQACFSGGTPQYFGCGFGFQAAMLCDVGNEAA